MNRITLIGELLHTANSYPPFHWKREFYELKDYLLRRYGTVQEMDLQHIVKECYACNGERRITETVLSFGEPFKMHTKTCYKCNGTGTYEEFWIYLLRYQLGRHTFHIPGKKFYSRERAGWISGDEIDGYIVHRHPDYYLYAEATYWLALFFDRALFFRKFGHSGYPAMKFTPMVILATLVFNVRMFPGLVHNRWRWLMRDVQAIRQRYCRHDFGSDEYQCRKCHAYNPDNDVPF